MPTNVQKKKDNAHAAIATFATLHQTLKQQLKPLQSPQAGKSPDEMYAALETIIVAGKKGLKTLKNALEDRRRKQTTIADIKGVRTIIATAKKLQQAQTALPTFTPIAVIIADVDEDDMDEGVDTPPLLEGEDARDDGLLTDQQLLAMYDAELPQEDADADHEIEPADVEAIEMAIAESDDTDKQYQDALGEIERVQRAVAVLSTNPDSSDLLRGLNDFIAQIRLLESTVSKTILTNYIKHTSLRITSADKMNHATYETLAKSAENSEIPGLKVLGAIMIAIGAALAIIGLALAPAITAALMTTGMSKVGAAATCAVTTSLLSVSALTAGLVSFFRAPETNPLLAQSMHTINKAQLALNPEQPAEEPAGPAVASI